MVRLPSGAGYWTVLDEELSVVPFADAFLRHLRFGRDGAESTTKAYAGAIALFLRWCARTGRDWQGGAEQLGLFMVWLAHAGPPASGIAAGSEAAVLAGPGSVPVRSARRVNAVLTAVRGMIVHAVAEGTAPGRLVRLLFEVADDADLPAAVRGEDGSTGWRVRARHRLHETERPVGRAADADIVALLGGCCSARDRLIVLLMARAGLRRGEALGLRRSDVHLLTDSRELGCEVARAHLHVVRRDDNPNGAVAKSRRQRAVPLDFLVVQAFDSYEFERMDVPAAASGDFVFVNLFRAPLGAPMRLRRGRRPGHRCGATRRNRRIAPPSATAFVCLECHRCRRHPGGGPGPARACEHHLHAGLRAPGPCQVARRSRCGAQPARAGRRPGMNTATARVLLRGTSEGREFSHVLAGVLLDGEAARLAAALDQAFLDEAGWDPVRRVLSMPAGHRLLGRAICKLSGCEAGLRDARAGVCCRCLTRLKRAGMTEEQIKQAEHLPPAPGRTTRCAVPGCQRGPASAHADLCKGHAQQSRRMRSPGLEQFLADPRVRPLGPAPGPECAVCACTRPSRSCGFCDVHYQRWMRARRADPCLDAGEWSETQQPATAGGLVGMYVLAPLVAVQVLAGLQQRTLDGAKTSASDLRMACRALASQRVTAIGECDIECVPAGTSVRPLLRALARHARLAVSDPGSEQDRDTWDLAVFGHRGQLDFTGITQRWLRESAKRWAAHDLPRHRGTGASNVGNVVSSAARLSESLRTRPDRGDQPAALGRRDIESFLSRLAYLETAGTISRFQRNLICRGTRTVLAAVRDLSLARARPARVRASRGFRHHARRHPRPPRTRGAGT